jgi:hypothetical protein
MKLSKTLKINLTQPLEANPQVTLEQVKRLKAALSIYLYWLLLFG